MLFVPRQVALASRPAAAMAKEEPKKEKSSKSKAAKGSDARTAMLTSVAAFLESSGFPRTLAALQSEANLEGDAWRSSPVRLEDLFSKFVDSSSSAPVAGIAVGNEQEKTADGVAEEEDAGKKKKKKKKGGVEAREPESKASEPSAPEKPCENADGATKEKRQKKKKDSSSARNDDGGEANETVKSDDQKLDGRKKKSKKQEKDDDVEPRLEKVELVIKNRFEAAEKPKEDGKKLRKEEPKSQNNDADKNGLGDGAPLDKGKKKKRGKSTSETSDKVDAGNAPAKVEGKSNGAKENSDAVEKGKDDNEKKGKKKQKKLGSEENVLVEDKQVAGKDSVPKSDENKTGMDIDKGEDGRPSTDNAVVGKKRKLEEVEGSKPPAKEDSTDNQKLNNGFVEDDTKEHSTVSKPSKRQKHSSEPKIVNAFQRVKVEEVKFADDRLQDNSYWAKGGADSGYGAKAQEILGQVRGRGFRHEKTKKKRGTYRGGQIDLQTHSIKFNDSDEE